MNGQNTSDLLELSGARVVSGPRFLRTKALIGSCVLVLFFFLTGISVFSWVASTCAHAWIVTENHYLARWESLKGNTALASVPNRQETIERVAGINKVSSDLIRAIIWKESKGDPYALSTSRAIGLCQVLASWANSGKLKHLGITKALQLVDETKNIEAGGFVLGWNMQATKGDAYRALFMYYAGTDPDEKTRKEGEAYAKDVLNILATKAWVKG